VLQSIVGQCLHIIEISRSYSDTPHSVALHRLSYQPDTVTRLDNTQHSYERDICTMVGFELAIPVSKRP